jgi:parallel beta-helix repeat protein
MFDLITETKTKIGQAPDSIIAFNVNDGTIREGGQGNDLEENKVSDDTYRVICLDESQNITIFSN